MHKTPEEAAVLAAELKTALDGSRHKIMVAPSFTALSRVAEVLKGSSLLLGAQNMAAEEEGAHTGETSVLMLKALGVDAVILGHSERRHVYGESDGLINRKVKLALRHGLEVILCIGETLEEREAGRVNAVVEEQTRKGLEAVSAEELSQVTLAYEPVWAIGTGKTATPDDAEAVHKKVRQVLAGLYSSKAADEMIIQYGGSVKPGNAAELMAREPIDGALVGGASLKAETFIPIAQYDK